MKNNSYTFLSTIILFLCSNGFLFSQTSGSITQGIGAITIADMMPGCPSNHVTPLGTIQSSDGKNWIVPSDNHFNNAPHLPDLYNSCSGITPAALSGINLNSLPVTVLDPTGDTITAYLFCDNYFELYINDVLIGVDAVPFTPFNSSVVRFKVSRPYTVAVKLVDWEEHPGIGSEIQSTTVLYHPGDGGFIARFSDGTVTDTSWKAQSFYIAPLQNTNDVVELPDGTHSTTAATLTPNCDANCFGVHYDEPLNWTSPLFDDSGWPKAYPYTAAQVTNQPAYVNFANAAWSGATFIWSQNLILDNVVLVRKTIPAFSGINVLQNNHHFMASCESEDHLLVSCDDNFEHASISLFDLSGRIIGSWPDQMISKIAIRLSLPSNVVSGLYLLNIRNAAFSSSVKINIQTIP